MLRDYQTDLVNRMREAIRRSRSVLCVAPTGSGKTVVAAEVARLARLKKSRTLLLVHRRELIDQAARTLEDACPNVQLGILAAGYPRIPWADLHIGMVQSILHMSHVPDFQLVMQDEAHHAPADTFSRVLKRWPEAYLAGFTATPERLDGLGMTGHFNEMVIGPSIPALVKQSHLAPCRTLRIPPDTPDEVVADPVKAYMRYGEGRRAIFFCQTIEHSLNVCGQLRGLGVRAEHVDGSDSTARRDRIMAEFKSGALDVVGNVNLIDEGFDAPACDCAVICYKTGSVTRWLQMCGRPMRPDYPGKVALIFDLGGASHDLGTADEDREWTLEDGEVVTGKRERPCCPRCFTVYNRPPCPECGYVPTRDSRRQKQQDVDLEEAKPNARARRKPRMTRREIRRQLALARRSPDPAHAVRELGKRCGYKPGWAFYILEVWGMRDSTKEVKR